MAQNFQWVFDILLDYGYNAIEKRVANDNKFSPGVVALEIKRDFYLQKLIAKKHNGLIKVITGMRRCGKSYLLFTLFKKHLLECGVNENHIIEIPAILNLTSIWPKYNLK